MTLRLGVPLQRRAPILHSAHDCGVADGTIVHGYTINDGHGIQECALLEVADQFSVLGADPFGIYVVVEDFDFIPVASL